MEAENIAIAISGALGLFLSLVASKSSSITSFLLLFGFGLIFVSRTFHFLLMQYNRLDEHRHKMSMVMTGIGLFMSLIGILIGRFLSPSTIVIPVFGYYLFLAGFWTLSLIFFQGIVLRKFTDDMNIGTSKIEKRKVVKEEV